MASIHVRLSAILHGSLLVVAGENAPCGPTPTTNSCAGNRDKVPRRKCSQFLELIGSVAVAVPANCTRYMNQPCIYMGKVGETVKYGWARHPRRGDSGSHVSNADLVLPIQYAHQAAPSRRALRLLASRASQKDPRHGNASPGVGWLRAALPRGLSRAPTPLAPFKCSRLYRSGHASPLINSDGCGTISATFQLCPVSFWRSRLIAT